MRASRGEIKIEDILSTAGMNFKEEYSFPDLISSNPILRRSGIEICSLDSGG